MTGRKLGLSLFALAASVAATLVVVAPAAGAGAPSGVVQHLAPRGNTYFAPTAPGSGSLMQSPELGPSRQDGGFSGSSNSARVNRSQSSANAAPRAAAAPVVTDVSASNGASVVTSFDGLNHFDQRTANGGNQFSLEPPDQGLCAGNGVVVEVINDVIRVYSPTGAALTGVEDLNTFYHYPAAYNRTGVANPFGPFVTDPSCYYDVTAQRWFVDVLTLDVFSNNGNFTGSNHLDIAVSQTADPTMGWNLYSLQIRDDSTSGPNHGCVGIPPYGQATVPTYPNACFGDYPHLGADANAIFLTTNEYSFFGNTFHGAQVYAFSKADLVAGTSVSVVQFDTHGMDNGNSGFTLWPATAPGAVYAPAHGGTEWFLSSNAADEAHGDGSTVGPRKSTQLLQWSVTGTSSIDSSPGSLAISMPFYFNVGLYTVPARSVQKHGPTPLIECLNHKGCAENQLGITGGDPFTESEYPLDSNDTRMQQVVFSHGMLWAALDTGVQSSGSTRAGIEWFVVNPKGTPSLVNHGYLAVKGNNITYPAVTVTQSGKGVIAFTLVGRDYFPSAAFASMDVNGPGAVQVAAMGAGPADGFSGTFIYNYPNPPRPRWGDYGAAVVDGSNIWIASEYIGQTCDLATWIATLHTCGNTRTTLANWDTRITEVTP